MAFSLRDILSRPLIGQAPARLEHRRLDPDQAFWSRLYAEQKFVGGAAIMAGAWLGVVCVGLAVMLIGPMAFIGMQRRLPTAPAPSATPGLGTPTPPAAGGLFDSVWGSAPWVGVLLLLALGVAVIWPRVARRTLLRWLPRWAYGTSLAQHRSNRFFRGFRGVAFWIAGMGVMLVLTAIGVGDFWILLYAPLGLLAHALLGAVGFIPYLVLERRGQEIRCRRCNYLADVAAAPKVTACPECGLDHTTPWGRAYGSRRLGAWRWGVPAGVSLLAFCGLAVFVVLWF